MENFFAEFTHAIAQNSSNENEERFFITGFNPSSWGLFGYKDSILPNLKSQISNINLNQSDQPDSHPAKTNIKI
jgi:hypothetical protein